jgi:hypothetical protein
MSAKDDAHNELRTVLDLSLAYAKNTFPWPVDHPIVLLCRSADAVGTTSTVNSNVLGVLYVLLFGQNEFDWDGDYLEGLEHLVQTDG